jgi:tartrate dehydratase alpha subunit/fumarate hydratase class I-like protein
MKVRQFFHSLSVALPPDHWEQIKKITDEKQISMSHWVREAVAAALVKIQREEELTNDE